jgi:hypothetical protein
VEDNLHVGCPWGPAEIGWRSQQIGKDLYLNPWWGLQHLPEWPARYMVSAMTRLFGVPDFWDSGWTPRLLWGRREDHMTWRPSFSCHISGPQAKFYYQFWFPWRGRLVASANVYGRPELRPEEPIIPHGGNIESSQVALSLDVPGLQHFAECRGVDPHKIAVEGERYQRARKRLI